MRKKWKDVRKVRVLLPAQVSRLGKLCTLTNCLDLYFFVDTFCDGAEHGGLHRKVRLPLLL